MAIRCIKGVAILDMDGRRVCAKYFDQKLSKDEQQRQFEAQIFAKTKNMSSQQDAEVIMLERNIVVFRNPADVFFYVVGAEEGNELIYAALLNGLFEAVSGLLRGKVEKQTILENLELILLTLDELVDDGIILEIDSLNIANRVLMKGANGEESGGGGGAEYSKPQSFGSRFLNAFG